MDKEKIYQSLPIFAQNIVFWAEGTRIKHTRYGPGFWRLLSDYESRNGYSQEQLAEYRNKRLVKMVAHCYNTVPYYRKLFYEGGINYESIRTPDDLRCLPILTKDIVWQNYNDFISEKIPVRKMKTGHTSGTTGSGFIFRTTLEAEWTQWAVWWRYRRNLGIAFDMWCAFFGGRPVVPSKQNSPPFWRVNHPCRQIYFSAYHANEENLFAYYNEINRAKVPWIHGYPSQITLLASFMLEKNLRFLHPIRFVTIGAESLLDYQINCMQKAFGVKPRQHYGLAEGVANFSENTDGNILIDEDYSVVELLPVNEGSLVVGTTLTNFAMPLLRWETKDIVSYHIGTDGRRYIDSIDGRIEDYIKLPDGAKVGRLDVVFKDATSFREVQVVQHKDYSITVYVVGCGDDLQADILSARQMFANRIGDKVHISFESVENIQRTPGGKLRLVVSELKD